MTPTMARKQERPLRPHRLDKRNPVGVERIDEFISGFDEVLSDPALGDKIHHGKKQEGFAGCAMVGDHRLPIPALVGSKFSKHLEVVLKHLSERAPHPFLFLIIEIQSD
jgi:hypothetical protein